MYTPRLTPTKSLTCHKHWFHSLQLMFITLLSECPRWKPLPEKKKKLLCIRASAEEDMKKFNLMNIKIGLVRFCTPLFCERTNRTERLPIGWKKVPLPILGPVSIYLFITRVASLFDIGFTCGHVASRDIQEAPYFSWGFSERPRCHGGIQFSQITYFMLWMSGLERHAHEAEL